MLRNASGLGDPTLPFYLRFRYKTYDAYGKPTGEGIGEYTWIKHQVWHEKFAENGRVWEFWKTEKGSYTPKGQIGNNSYPASLILTQYFHPLGDDKGNRAVPPYFGKMTFGQTSLSCFSSKAKAAPLGVETEYHQEDGSSTDLIRACTVPDKPFLLLRQGDYNVFFEQDAVFAHRIVAKRILIRDGADPVADVDLELLRAPDAEQIHSIEPPVDALFEAVKPGVAYIPSRLLKKVDPKYPPISRQKSLQGTVRIAATIGVDGKLKNLEVLHSPAPDLSFAAIGAVEQWMYTPYLADGKPIEVSTQVNVTFSKP